jgi:DNA-directed RNA polymerase specialized sigma24 family protein
VHKGLIALPKHQQVVLILVYHRDYTVKEAAVMLTVSKHTAESLLARACKSMRAAVELNREDLIGAGS